MEYPREWFRAGRYADTVEARLFHGETEHTLKSLRGHRTPKVTVNGTWYSIREEAEAVVLANRLARAERQRLYRLGTMAPRLLDALEAVFPVARLSHEARDQIVALIKEARS